MTLSLDTAVFDVIADDAARESQLWAQALKPAGEREHLPIFSPLIADPRFALGVETIYEGYLVHYGQPRLFAPAGADTALLLGDYLYAHGLVRVAATGVVAAVDDLAELISLCAQVRADGTDGDGAAWAATAARLGEGRLEAPRDALRTRRDASALDTAARAAAGDEACREALAAHRLRTGG